MLKDTEMLKMVWSEKDVFSTALDYATYHLVEISSHTHDQVQM